MTKILSAISLILRLYHPFKNYIFWNVPMRILQKWVNGLPTLIALISIDNIDGIKKYSWACPTYTYIASFITGLFWMFNFWLSDSHNCNTVQLLDSLEYSNVPNRRVGLNKHASGKILEKIKRADQNKAVQGGIFSQN